MIRMTARFAAITLGVLAGLGLAYQPSDAQTPAGGTVYLIGQNVENQGIIKTPQGQILLAAGKSIELVDAHTP